MSSRTRKLSSRHSTVSKATIKSVDLEILERVFKHLTDSENWSGKDWIAPDTKQNAFIDNLEKKNLSKLRKEMRTARYKIDPKDKTAELIIEFSRTYNIDPLLAMAIVGGDFLEDLYLAEQITSLGGKNNDDGNDRRKQRGTSTSGGHRRAVKRAGVCAEGGNVRRSARRGR